jgi:hypothetical protein
MANENCLEDMQCPECGSLEPFRIAVTTTTVFWDEGSDPLDVSGEMEFEEDGYCTCMTCDYQGQVKDFRDVPTVACKFCDEQVLAKTAHLHRGSWVGESCCWDERLRMRE